MDIQGNAVELAGTMDSTAAAVRQPARWLLPETYWPKVANTKCFSFSYKQMLKKNKTSSLNSIQPAAKKCHHD